MSPIEEKLIKALRALAEPHGQGLRDYTGREIDLDLSDPLNPRHVDPNLDCGDFYGDANAYGWSLHADVQFLTYRIDLLLMFGNGAVCIECDGHEWHERTKQQAAYDRSRDRDLLRHGYSTIRFTGSEIHHSAERCASEVYEIAAALEKSGEMKFEGLCAQRDREVARKRAAGLLPLEPRVVL